ncbi:TetR/AcrR family transcriptional regulator [Cohnella kolymensis]|uniref:TetR/AcrR family transcriptional regulator n=1 Tax=Cohnella kolymensis TaxID=1590652 RepID=UPI0006976456|nr:TetR/AcrR family transcriptional regulator [Cohnella kolymensis]
MTARRERKDAAEHRRVILETAENLFNQHGVHTVSMHQIAKTAGVGQATLYRRYAHKGELCIDLIQDYSEQLTDHITAYLEDHKESPPSERLAGILDHWVDAIEEKSELIVTMEANTNCEDPRRNFFHSPMYQFFRNKLSQLVTEMLGPNPATPIDAEVAAHGIICAMAPVGYFQIKQEKGYTKEQMKEQYRQICALPHHNIDPKRKGCFPHADAAFCRERQPFSMNHQARKVLFSRSRATPRTRSSIIMSGTTISTRRMAPRTSIMTCCFTRSVDTMIRLDMPKMSVKFHLLRKELVQIILITI